jgi:hypothetical protein
MKKHLVIGLGEVGSSLLQVLKKAYDVEGLDSPKGIYPTGEKFDIIHVCIPYYGDGFVEAIKELLARYLQNYNTINFPLTIIHSTVPVGTTQKFGPNTVHSPIRGIHPHLVEGLLGFEKVFGGMRSLEASSYFSAEPLNIRTSHVLDSRITEALKLWDTTQYGWQIILEKEMHNWCVEEFGDKAQEVMDVIYRKANKEYNRIYRDMGRPEVGRPYLKHYHGPIGGHCVIPNAKLLPSTISEVLDQFNETY